MQKLSDYIKNFGGPAAANKFGYHLNAIYSLSKRGAIIVDGVIYAPVVRRVRNEQSD